jgi:very-short-patch-repair endonuclease
MDIDIEGLERFADAAAAEARGNFKSLAAALAVRCGSPIEQRLAFAITVVFRTYGVEAPWRIEDHAWDRYGSDEPATGLYLQANVGKYRPDFLFDIRRRGQHRRALVIECDGHNFHERTKEQAARDRSRDRWMVSEHITVLRFTGSEIWRDAEECADQVFGAYQQAHED